MHLWDTAGDPRFKTITNSYYRGAHGIMLCFDVSDPESFEILKKEYLPDVLRHTGINIVIKLVGLKGDLPQLVTEEAIQAFIQYAVFSFFPVFLFFFSFCQHY